MSTKIKTDKGTFINETIFPVKIIHVNGNVDNEEALLKERELQITTCENELCTLENKLSGKSSEIVLDFGREYHGKVRILTHSTEGKSPAELQITYGESVSEAMSEIGCNGATNDHATRDFSFPFPDYSDISLNESGFRFVRIRLKGKKCAVRLKAVVLTAVYRDLNYLGTFNCSDELLNNIYDISRYTCHLNMQQYIWDGIKRDRLVWVGDMHPEMLTVKTCFGVNSIIPESLNFMRKSTPLPRWMNSMPTYSLWWLIILYDWYFYSGDEEFLRENTEYAKELIRIVCDLVAKDGKDKLPSYFLDWPCNDKPQGISGSRALLSMALNKASELSVFLNEKDLSLLCKQKSDILQKTEMNTYAAKQVTAIASLSGWIDKQEAGKEILKNSSNGWSTFMSYYLLSAAQEYSMSETLNALKEYYGGMINAGATTFWEDFDIKWTENAGRIDEITPEGKSDIHADNGAFCYKGLRHSLCHGWASGPAPFLCEYVLGVKVAEKGCKKIIISPNLSYLDFAEGTFPTPYGLLSVKCRKENSKTIIEYDAPEEITVIIEEKVN